LNGSVPYLELPGTGSDINQRIGRGYTISRFKGPSFFYNEMEYRFPLTNNKLLSGVLFFNMETAGNQKNVRLFDYWEPGAGAGLRILFDKHTRSNLCIDYGFGNYGSRGIFVGLNEVF
jgi:outer membrane protein assembly factor BamA